MKYTSIALNSIHDKMKAQRHISSYETSFSQPPITCLKLTIETQEQGVILRC